MAAQTSTIDVAQPDNVPVAAWIGPVVAAWLIPGAGHFLLKKRGRAALIFLSVVATFFFGLAMGGMMFTPEKGADYLTSLINYGGFAANLSAGALYLLNSMFGTPTPDMAGAVHDYGTKFLVTAGLLNILAMVDTWEIATGKKD
jgi:TM2 domain-containing membrane protein YozV